MRRVLLRSSREAHFVGDIIAEIDHARAFIDGLDGDALGADLKTLYAVEKALQNVSEACIQLNGKRGENRFADLFPDQNYDDLRRLGNLLRHDYGALDPMRIWTEVVELMPSLRSRAVALLDAHRRGFGQAPDTDD